MAKVIWKPNYPTRIGLKPTNPFSRGELIELKPGTNELDDDAMTKLRGAEAFDRLRKAGHLVVQGERADASASGNLRANPPTPPPQPRPTGPGELTGSRVAWNESMDAKELAAVLEQQGIPAKGMKRADMVATLRSLDDDRHSDRTSPDAGRH